MKSGVAPKWKKAWVESEWGHKCRRSGALSFWVRGKQWEGELQGPTWGPPLYEKKKGEKKKTRAPPPPHTLLLQVSIQTWTRRGSLKYDEGCGNGLHSHEVSSINLLLFLPSLVVKRSRWIWWGVCVVVGPMFLEKQPTSCSAHIFPSKEGTIKEVY